MDAAKQAKVAQVLGPDFIGRTQSSGKESLFSPLDTVSYSRNDEVHLGLDLSRDVVSRNLSTTCDIFSHC